MAQCEKCKKNEAVGEVKELKFRYKGLNFKLELIPYDQTRCKNCLIKPVKERFDKRAKDIIKAAKGEIEIDWDKYVERWERHLSDYVSDFEIDFWHILVWLQIVRLYAKGEKGWMLNPNNPMLSGFPLMFERKEDAIAYKQARWPNAIYPIHVYNY